MIKIVPKILTLLELFISGDEFSFGEIIELTGLTRSNVSHLLQSLCEERMLTKVRYGRYRRGERLIRFCTEYNPWQSLLSMAGRCADNLVGVLNELAVVGMRNHDLRLTLVKRHPVKRLQVNQDADHHYLADWYSTANGRILLAYAPHDVLESIVRRSGLPAHNIWRGAGTLPRLETELKKIREQGYTAFQVDETVRALGVVVRDASGAHLLSLATAYPVFSCRKSDAEVVKIMKFLAAAFEKELRISSIRVADLEQQTNIPLTSYNERKSL